MANAQYYSNKQKEDCVGDRETMHQAHQANTMKAFLSKTNMSVVSRYILNNPWIEIVSIDRIGEYWLMTLSNLDRGARADIVSLIGFYDEHEHEHEHEHDHDHDSSEGSA